MVVAVTDQVKELDGIFASLDIISTISMFWAALGKRVNNKASDAKDKLGDTVGIEDGIVGDGVGSELETVTVGTREEEVSALPLVGAIEVVVPAVPLVGIAEMVVAAVPLVTGVVVN